MTPSDGPRHYISVSLAAAVCGVVAAALLLGATRWTAPRELRGPVADGGWTGRTRGWLTARGFFSIEIDERSKALYSWTAETARISLANLNRSQAHTLAIVFSAGRPEGQPDPLVTLTVDGAAAVSCRVTNTPAPCVAVVPARAADRAVIGLQVTPVYVPGGPDTRTLGVIAHELILTPASGHFVPSWPVLGATAAAVALAVAAVLLCGVSGSIAAIAAVGIGLSFVWLLLQDGAYVGGYVDSLLNVAIGAAIGGALVALLRRLWPIAGAPDWSVAAGLVLAATVVKLGFFNHPLATIGDGIFQLHRAQMVRAGAYFFTSITPRPFFEFPYAIGLYVTALPFWSRFPTDIDQVHLLRGVALGADALVGIACYVAVFRQWGDRRAALLVAGLWPFARAPLEALCNSNLTNVFGQGLFGVAMAGLAWIAAAGASAPAVAIALAFLTGAYLSHFSTFSVGVPLVGVVACALVAVGRGRTRRAGWWVLAIGLVAAGVAYAAYYSHFTEVYRATWARVASHETVEAAGSSIAATPATKLQRWASGTSDDYGLPGLVLAAAAAIGAFELTRRRLRDGLTLVLGGWLAIWIGFTLLGILSAVQMRVNLAAAPLFVCLGAYGLATLGARSRTGLLISGMATVAIIVNGARLWVMCIGR